MGFMAKCVPWIYFLSSSVTSHWHWAWTTEPWTLRPFGHHSSSLIIFNTHQLATVVHELMQLQNNPPCCRFLPLCSLSHLSSQSQCYSYSHNHSHIAQYSHHSIVIITATVTVAVALQLQWQSQSVLCTVGYCGLRYLLWATVRVTVRVLLQLRLQSRLGYSWLQGYSYSHIPTYAYSDAYAYSHSHSQGSVTVTVSSQGWLIMLIIHSQVTVTLYYSHSCSHRSHSQVTVKSQLQFTLQLHSAAHRIHRISC